MARPKKETKKENEHQHKAEEPVAPGAAPENQASTTPESAPPAPAPAYSREERRKREEAQKQAEQIQSWKPKTRLGKKVKEGVITDLKNIFEQGLQILEPEIVDTLMPNNETDLLLVGQAKGKFGGGQRRVFKQTQKKTMEGNKPKFSAYAVIGNRDGFVGIGKGKAKETVPAREKALRNARLNIRMIRRGCGSWQCNCRQPHSVPYTVKGRCGSVEVRLIPAPKGKGLVSEKECQKVLGLAGIKDVWVRSYGNTGTKANLIKACVKALEALITTKIQPLHRKALGIIDGPALASRYETAQKTEAAGTAE